MKRHPLNNFIFIRYLLMLYCFIIVIIAKSQQQPPVYSEYMFNPLIINPAYAGSQDALNISSLVRRQWISVNGAPFTTLFTADTPLKNKQTSLGLLISNDQIGIFNHALLNGIYVHKINISEEKTLSFGLQGGLSDYTARYYQLNPQDPNDPTLGNSNYNSLVPDFGGGIYYKNSNKMYAGISAPFIASNILRNKQITNHIQLKNYYYLYAGYVVNISYDLKIKPNILVRYVSGLPVQADINTNILFKEAIWIGFSYRTSHTASTILQLNISDQFRIGYAYDFHLGKTPAINNASHEIMVNYLFVFKKTKINCPRYF